MQNSVQIDFKITYHFTDNKEGKGFLLRIFTNQAADYLAPLIKNPELRVDYRFPDIKYLQVIRNLVKYSHLVFMSSDDWDTIGQNDEIWNNAKDVEYENCS